MGGSVPEDKNVENIVPSISTIPHVEVEDDVDTIIYDGNLYI